MRSTERLQPIGTIEPASDVMRETTTHHGLNDQRVSSGATRAGDGNRSTALGAVHRGRGSSSMLATALRGRGESRPAASAGKDRTLGIGFLLSRLAARLGGLLDPYVSHLLLPLLLFLLAHHVLRCRKVVFTQRLSSNRERFISFHGLIPPRSHSELHFASGPQPQGLNEVACRRGNDNRTDPVFGLNDDTEDDDQCRGDEECDD